MHSHAVSLELALDSTLPALCASSCCKRCASSKEDLSELVIDCDVDTLCPDLVRCMAPEPRSIDGREPRVDEYFGRIGDVTGLE